MPLLITPLLPPYSEARALIQVWSGLPRADVQSMINSIMDQTGTPQNPIDWSSPNQWIDERLKGKDAEIARATWKAGINPRHTRGSSFLLERHELLLPDNGGIYQTTERGLRFLNGELKTIQEIDEAQGLYPLLSIISVNGPARPGEFFDEWSEIIKSGSKYQSTNSLKAVFRYALTNLLDRELITREGHKYSVTDKGIAHLEKRTDQPEAKAQRSLASSVQFYNSEQKKLLLEKLGSMHPFRFEHLVKELLDAMDYEDVQVTKQSGDGGVDVIAKFQFGITEVTEVVQVKRQSANVGRRVLDELRGSLHRFGAIRATIITTSGFAKGCVEEAIAPGAPPITLIDGTKLVDMLCQHRIGIREQHLTLLDVDEIYFTAPEEEVAE